MEWLIIFVGGVLLGGSKLPDWISAFVFSLGLTAVIYGIALVWGIA